MTFIRYIYYNFRMKVGIGLKRQIIEEMLAENNGVLKTSEVVAAGISKEYFYQYVKKAGLWKAAHGIYISPDVWPDEMYLLQAQIPQAVYSHETALYLHGLAEKEPVPLTVTVEAKYNSPTLAKKGVHIVYVKKEWHELGLCELTSPGGHRVVAYDMERTICDIIRKRSEMDAAVCNYALIEYMRHRGKNLSRLMAYAEKMRLEKRIRETMGVLF